MSAPLRAGTSGLLPTGTVTFVFTDIEGSTRRWERHPVEMEQAVRRHDELVRSAIVEHGGHVFKTIGDAFCAAFGRPPDAVSAILAIQRSLAAEDFSAIDGLRVRAAIHTGAADERDGDYFGRAVNRVARLLAIGHGGQVLVSGVTADLVQGALPPQASLRDLGEHRLRDLARPEQVHQLLAPDLREGFPPLSSLDALPNNLPLTLKSFVGREAEIAEITALLDRHRLVTLVGSGGVGKTRTSLQVAANLLDSASDGVWFIELAPLTDGDFVPSAVAQAMGLTLPSDREPVAGLSRALKSNHALLVFDNCEHIIEPAGRVVSAILRECPDVKVLASSRQGLGIDGEETYRMPSLEIPQEDEAGHVSATEAIRSAAIALFVDRALAVNKRFVLTDENAPIIADICRRLDGIPLAIELAASRVKILSPRQLHERLDERFRVLTGGSRDVLPRQQTLRALIDWSYDLLDQRERMLFRRLSIFANGFILEGAVAVGGTEDPDEIDVLDVLASLVDKSLVLAEPDGESLRYRLLGSTRLYALEKLSHAGEFELLAVRHLHYLRHRFTELRAHQERTARKTELIDAFAAELEDVRAALDGALTRRDVLAGARLLSELGTVWEPIGLSNEGITRNDAFLAALPDDAALLLAKLSITLANMLYRTGRKERALEVATRAVAQARASADGPTLADALDKYAWVNLSFGRRDDAEEALLEAEEIPGASAFLRTQLLRSQAFLLFQKGEMEESARVWERLREEHHLLGNTRDEMASFLNNAEIEHARGRTRRAIALVNEILPAVRSGPEKQLAGNLLANLTAYLVAADDLPAAVEVAREVIEMYATDDSEDYQLANTVEHLALVYALRGDFARAAAMEGYVGAAFRKIGFDRELTERKTYDRLTALLHEGLAPAELARLTAEGAALKPEAAAALALEGIVETKRSRPDGST